MLKSRAAGGKVLWVERCNLFINQYKWVQRLFVSCMTGAVVLARVDPHDNYEKLKTQSSISWIKTKQNYGFFTGMVFGMFSTASDAPRLVHPNQIATSTSR